MRNFAPTHFLRICLKDPETLGEVCMKTDRWSLGFGCKCLVVSSRERTERVLVNGS